MKKISLHNIRTNKSQKLMAKDIIQISEMSDKTRDVRLTRPERVISVKETTEEILLKIKGE